MPVLLTPDVWTSLLGGGGLDKKSQVNNVQVWRLDKWPIYTYFSNAEEDSENKQLPEWLHEAGQQYHDWPEHYTKY